MKNYEIKPIMVAETLEDQVTAIEVLRHVLTGIRRERLENTVNSKELFDVLSSKRIDCIVNNVMDVFRYKDVTKEQLAVLCDYFQTEVLFNGWKLHSVDIEEVKGKNKEYEFIIAAERDDVSMSAAYRNNILAIVKIN